MDAHNLHWQLASVCAPPVENLHLATDLIAVFSRDGRALLLGSPSRTDHGQLEPFLVPQKRRVLCGAATSAAALSEPQTFLVANYDCRGLGQSGAGHISSVGALSPAPDRLLVLDVVACKYPCAWVPVPRRWGAMNTVEADSGRTRSDLLVSTLAAHEGRTTLSSPVRWRHIPWKRMVAPRHEEGAAAAAQLLYLMLQP